MAEGERTERRGLLRLRNAAQVVCVCSGGERLLRGAAQGRLAVVPGGAVLVGLDGRLLAVGPTAELDAAYAGWSFERDEDAAGRVVLPGLVDAHTHPVWSGDRVHEMALKLAGASYLDIHRAGGGIALTVGCTRASPEAELAALLRARLDRMLACGTTLAEAKSGYGLDTPSELKLLRVLHGARGAHPLELVETFLGAHSVPPGLTAAQAADAIVAETLPAIAAARARGEVDPELVDAFVEEGVYGRDEARRVLLAGRAAGMDINFHGDELHDVRAGELAGELGALAASHLEELSEAGIAAMGLRPTCAVLLPTTAYLMRLKAPPARRLIAAGVPVALGSDYNPNAHCLSLPLVMNLACVTLGLSMEEALAACTINAAASIGRSADYGSLEPRKWADLLVLDAPRWEHLIYQMADPPIARVYKKGRLVWSSPAASASP
eukprot:m51a1_g14144 putative imidazolonepropionase (438) ;mRNA; f:10734-12047